MFLRRCCVSFNTGRDKSLTAAIFGGDERMSACYFNPLDGNSLHLNLKKVLNKVRRAKFKANLLVRTNVN